VTFVENNPFFHNPSASSSYSSLESTSFLTSNTDLSLHPSVSPIPISPPEPYVPSPLYQNHRFIHHSSHGRTFLLLHVDDMLITSDDEAHISSMKRQLSKMFMMSDLGPLTYFLGIDILHSAKGYYLS
jgi:hypothetical protein